MSAITTHILDTSTGKPGAGIPVVLERKTHSSGWQDIADGITDVDGRVSDFIAVGDVFLEEGAFRRVGGLKDIQLNARIIAASNRNLKQECKAGNFRLDLYFRLSVIQVDIPPLRDRGRDVLQLTDYYIKKANLKRRGKLLSGLAKDVEKIFLNYAWPGNVRELRNVIERASILEDGEVVTAAHLPADMVGIHAVANPGTSTILLPAAGVSLESVEFELAKQAYDRTNGNLTRAAKLLDISRDQLRYKLRKAGFEMRSSSDDHDD